MRLLKNYERRTRLLIQKVHHTVNPICVCVLTGGRQLNKVLSGEALHGPQSLRRTKVTDSEYQSSIEHTSKYSL